MDTIKVFSKNSNGETIITEEDYEYVSIEPDDIVINYEEEVERLIRQRYTVSEELAIQRQRFDKPEEFDVYNNYCEECKNQVKQLINETQG